MTREISKENWDEMFERWFNDSDKICKHCTDREDGECATGMRKRNRTYIIDEGRRLGYSTPDDEKVAREVMGG